jgi:hypothetical protein
MSRIGAAPRAAVPISNARAEASRRNGARSRGPKTPEGKAPAAQNALKHGMRAQKYVLLPQEDATAFAALETTILAELAPIGVLQTLLARRVAVAAWRLERADRMEAEVLEFRSYDDANAGLALLGPGVGERGPNPVPAAKGWQRHPLVRHADALPRRRHGRVHARPAHLESAPGRTGGRRHGDARQQTGRARHPAGASASGRQSSASKRTLSCGSVAWRWGAHPVHGVGARGRRSERTQGLSPSLSMIPPPRFF